MMRARLIILLGCLALAACGEPNADLNQWIKDQDKLPPGRIPPLPEVKPYEPFT